MKYIRFLLIGLCLLFIQQAVASDDTRFLSAEPKEIYGNGVADIAVRIGNGGAGPTGILRALSEDYITENQIDSSIAWYQDISPNTLRQLEKKVIDIALVYEKKQANQALEAGWATHYTPIFNDHFIIVGPKKNPAKLKETDTAQEAFTKIAAQGKARSRLIFLSRDDNSGTNVKEQSIWRMAGEQPWVQDDIWYKKFHVFPKDALLEADKEALYTITDRGTWLSNRDALKNTVIYVQGGEFLLNPCFALLGEDPSSAAIAFLEYLTSARAQQLIENFGKDRYEGEALFTPANQHDFK